MKLSDQFNLSVAKIPDHNFQMTNKKQVFDFQWSLDLEF
jgi:hypothetical protein